MSDPGTPGGPQAGGVAPPPDPAAILRSRGFKALLVFAAVIGVVVSFLSWCFLELVHLIQVGVFEKLPDALGFDSVPSWWAIPWLLLAGLSVALVLAAEDPQSNIGDPAKLKAATKSLDEITKPLADHLMDKAMEALLRKRGMIQ